MVNWFSPWNLLSRTHVRLNQPVFKECEDNSACLLTAGEAWNHAVGSFGWDETHVAIKEIESVGGVNTDGTAFSWRFCIDLLDQQATATVVWESLRGAQGCVIGGRLRCTSSPYPVIGSPIHQIVAQGMGSEKLLNAAWQQMRENSSDLPWDFIDSDQVALDAFEQGWVGTYQLRTTEHNNTMVWEVHHNDQRLLFQLSHHAPALQIE